jgi:hypothetical protein
MPLADIRLLFETLVQCTRSLCKCEMKQGGSKDCNQKAQFSREPVETAQSVLGCGAKPFRAGTAALDSAGQAP